MKRMPISTPYSYPIVSESSRCAQEPDITYTPYDLFALRSQLLPYLQDVVDHDVDIQLPTTPIHDRMVVMVVPIIGGDYIQITKDQEIRIQRRVDEITSKTPKMLLLYTWNNQTTLEDGTPIPTIFVKQILPYIRLLPQRYTDAFSRVGETFDRVSTDQMADPYYDGERGSDLASELQTSDRYPPIQLTLSTYGLYVNLTGYDLLETGKLSTQLPSFLEMYNYLVMETERQIRSLYLAGAILGAHDIQQQWLLSDQQLTMSSNGSTLVVGGSGLYLPTWKDQRFAPDIQAFLSSRLLGDKDIRVRILRDKQWQIQHQLAIQIPNIRFEDAEAIVDVETLEEARNFANIVDSIQSGTLPNVEVTFVTYLEPNVDVLSTDVGDDVVTYRYGNLQVLSKVI